MYTPSGHGKAPPAPPPLPTPTPTSHEAHQLPSHFRVAEKESGFWKKFQYAQGAFYEPSNPPPLKDLLAPRTGPYFFYGTLMDPSILMEILNLMETPILRPAKIIVYSSKIWGQYPALVDGPQDSVVEDAMYEVQSEKHAARLAEYETKAYRTTPCRIRLTDGEEPSEVYGTTFKYAGPKMDLDEGDFDLSTWLRHMGRGKFVDDLQLRRVSG